MTRSLGNGRAIARDVAIKSKPSADREILSIRARHNAPKSFFERLFDRLNAWLAS